jgi:hypothetical protein
MYLQIVHRKSECAQLIVMMGKPGSMPTVCSILALAGMSTVRFCRSPRTPADVLRRPGLRGPNPDEFRCGAQSIFPCTRSPTLEESVITDTYRRQA